MLVNSQSFTDSSKPKSLQVEEIKNYLKQAKKIQKFQPQVYKIFDKIERTLDDQPVKYGVSK